MRRLGTAQEAAALIEYVISPAASYMAFDNGERIGRVVLDADGRVAGLFMLSPDGAT